MTDIEQIQYIGARYVPKIYKNSVDPSSAEWESGVNYEPLTIVTEGYNSYTSRDFVPKTVGSPSENGLYWARTGNYDGQIATLQQQIDDMKDGEIAGSLQNQINAIDVKLANSIASVKDYGAKGDGITDDTESFNSAIADNNILFIPSGTYMVTGITINKDITIIGSGVTSVIKASEAISAVITMTNGGSYSPSNFGLPKTALKDLVIDCDDKANIGIDLEYASWNVIENINIYHPITRGVSTHGAIGAGTRFNNILVIGVKNPAYNTYGMYIGSNDQHIENCTVIDCKYGFLAATSVEFDNCSAWVSDSSMYSGTYGYHITGRFCKMLNCWADTVNLPVVIGGSADHFECDGLNIINNNSVVAAADTNYTYLFTFQARTDGTQWYDHNAIIKNTFMGVDANYSVSNYPSIVTFKAQIETPLAVNPSKRQDTGGCSDYIKITDTYFQYEFTRISAGVARVKVKLLSQQTLANDGALVGSIELSPWSSYKTVPALALYDSNDEYNPFRALVQTYKFFVQNTTGNSVTLNDLIYEDILTF